MTSRPAPLRYGNPCWASPRGGTQHSGVVIRNDSVTNDITKTRKLPTAAACGQPRVQAEQQPVQDDHGPQAVGELVGPVRLVPGPVLRHECAFRVLVGLVVAGVGVEEAHERAVGDERHDPVRLVPERLQPADPEQHDDQPHPGHGHAHLVHPRRQFKQLQHAHVRISARARSGWSRCVRFSRRHDSSIGRCGGTQNGRMGRRHGQIAPAPDLRLELPEEGRRVAGRLLEQAAEVQFVAEAELPCDLLDRLQGVEQLPLGVDQDAVADEIGRRGPEVLPDDPAERLRRQVQPLGVVGGRVQRAVVLLDQVTQLGRGPDAGGRSPRPARTGPGRLEPRGEDQQDLQVGEHDLAVGEVALVVFLPDAVDQVRHFRLRPLVQRDHGDAVGVVEQDAAATDLGVERLDAEEVGVELDDLAVDRDVGDEPDVLVGDEEQQAVGAEGELRGVGPERPGPGLDQVDGEVVRAGRLERLAVEPQAFDADRLTAAAGVVQVPNNVVSTHRAPECCPATERIASLATPATAAHPHEPQILHLEITSAAWSSTAGHWPRPTRN